MTARVEAVTPAGFVADPARLPPPDLGEAPQIRLVQWTVETDGPVALVRACFSAQASGWLPEADEIALQKLSQTALSTALRAGVDATMSPVAAGREGVVMTETLEGEGLRCKTLLGFETVDGRDTAYGCFALCLRGASCREAADGARLDGALVPPPAPSLGLRALSWAVHHPGYAAAGLAILLVLGGILAVLTRRRPRSRPGRSRFRAGR